MLIKIVFLCVMISILIFVSKDLFRKKFSTTKIIIGIIGYIGFFTACFFISFSELLSHNSSHPFWKIQLLVVSMVLLFYAKADTAD